MKVTVKVTEKQWAALAEYLEPDAPGTALVTEMKGTIQQIVDTGLDNVVERGGPFAFSR